MMLPLPVRHRLAVVLAVAATVAACYMDEPANPVDKTVYSVVLGPDNVNVAVGATQPLAVTAFNGRGTVLAGAAPKFRSADTTKVQVSSTGVVTGVANGTTLVIASVTNAGVTKADTVTVRVSSAGATALGSLSLGTAPVTLAGNCTRFVAPTITDASGAPITPGSSGITNPYYVSRNTTVASTSNNATNATLTGVGVGTTYLVGTLTSGGVTKTDSVRVDVAASGTKAVKIADAGPNPAAVTLPAGCLVSFKNAASKPVDITFVSSAPTTTGGTAPALPSKISALAVGATQAVRFAYAVANGAPVTGTITYRDSVAGAASSSTGTVTTTAP